MVATEQAQTLEFRIVRQVKTQPPLTFTVNVFYSPEDAGYIAECFEMDAFAWGENFEEAVENLLDVIIGFAEVLVSDMKEFPNLQDPRLTHAQFILQLGDEAALRKVLGL
ncbi:MAG: hypothetical protein NZ805_10460 [Armatimonadetes bacterium]|nr:hypothetical protein [Armatimonadota bacterium]MDW8026990.1 hypothetical protein [Armatimonadota bacterium]